MRKILLQNLLKSDTDSHKGHWHSQTIMSGMKPIKTAQTRFCIVTAFMLLGFVITAGKLTHFSLQGLEQDQHMAQNATSTNEHNKSKHAARRQSIPPVITDRNGVLVAQNVESAGLYANASLVDNASEVTNKLLQIIPDLRTKSAFKRLSGQSKFVWLHRRLTPKQQLKVNDLGIPGLYFRTNKTRIYPHANLVSHLIGYRNSDGKGIAGIERALDNGMFQDQSDNDTLDHGDRFMLSIDIRIQHILRKALAETVRTFNASGGAIIVMDIHYGDIIGMISLPDFDPNRPGDVTDVHLYNRATVGRYELGSVFKVLNTAIAIDSGKVMVGSYFDAKKPLSYGRHVIRDYHAKKRLLSVPEIFIYSSNIGSAKMLLEAGEDLQQGYFKKLGLYATLDIPLAEKAHPLLPKKWRTINHITASFGHGISVTPLHFIKAFSATVNGGYNVNPTLRYLGGQTMRNANMQQEKIFKTQTSQQIRQLLRLNTLAGSGQTANIKGLLVGGKTGTAEKVSALGKYDKEKVVSSFVAAFPIDRPQYSIFAIIDEPQSKTDSNVRPTGGVVAAPLVGHVIRRLAPILNIPANTTRAIDFDRTLLQQLPKDSLYDAQLVKYLNNKIENIDP